MNAVRLTSIALGFVALASIGLTTNTHANTINVCKTTGTHGEIKYSQVISSNPTSDCRGGEIVGFRNDGRQNTPGALAPASVDPNVTADQNRIAELERQMKERDERDKAERCQRLRQNLNNLAMGGKLYETQPDGSRTFLNDQQITEQRARTEQTIAQHCTA